MGLESVILKSERERKILYDLTYIGDLKHKRKFKTRSSQMQETDWGLPEVRGWGEEKRGNRVKGTSFQVYEK